MSKTYEVALYKKRMQMSVKRVERRSAFLSARRHRCRQT